MTAEPLGDASGRIPALSDEFTDLVLAVYREGHGPVTPGECDRLADLAGELARLHSEESDYYRERSARWRDRRSGR